MSRRIAPAALALLLAACDGSAPQFVTGDCGDGLLECPDDVQFDCSESAGADDVPAATPCNDDVTITDDAPEGGFPVGATTVTYTAAYEGETDSCATVVTVTDTTAPTIECADAVTVARPAPDAAVAPPDPLAAGDDCDAAVEITADPVALPDGTTTVQYTATDDAGLTATCTTDVTVVGAYAVEGLRLLGASLAGGTTSVTIGWEPAGGAGATGYRVERAAAADGPWQEVATAALAEITYTDAALPDAHDYYRVVTLAGAIDGGATAPLHAYAIAAAAYDLRDQDVPGISFATTLYGVIRHPADLAAGPYPLVILIHGNHGNCRVVGTTMDYCETTNDHDCHSWGMETTPNAEGMLFQAEALAAAGHVAATISANALNCRDDYIPQRVQLVLEHLRRWQGWSTAAADPFGAEFVGAVDTARVGLVGHSRGGDAVSSVPLAIADTPIPGVTVASIFAIAPTDYHSTTPVGAPYAVLLPSCDGDVSNLWGKAIYDRALDPDDHAARAQVLYVGANHNFFNTEWTSDDGEYVCNGSALVGAAAQARMLAPVEIAWFRGTLGGAPLDRFARAEGGTPESIDAYADEDLDLRWSYAAALRLLVDEFEGAGTPDTNLLGEANSFDGFYDSGRCYQGGCGSAFEHAKGAAFLTWATDASAAAAFGLGGLDASAYSYLSFRVVSRAHSWNSGLEEQAFGMRLVDGDGDAAELLLDDVQTVPHLYPADTQREILQTVRVPLADLAAIEPALDLTALAAFELFFTVDGGRGSILVTDVELAE